MKENYKQWEKETKEEQKAKFAENAKYKKYRQV